MSDKVNFLHELSIFENLERAEIEALAFRTVEYEYPDRAVVAYQRDAADRLYIVSSGQLEAHMLDERGQEVARFVYESGDSFDDRWLLHPNAHPATVRAIGNSRVMILRGESFRQFLEEYPDAISRLEPIFTAEDDEELVAGMSPEAWQAAGGVQSVSRSARGFKSAGLLTDELVEFKARRSRWLLAIKIFFPTLLMIFVPLFLVSFVFPSLSVDSSSTLATIFALIPALLFFVFVLFQLADWWNDYFLITDKRIIHYEFNLWRFHATVTESPISQVQSVTQRKPNLLTNLLDVGIVEIKTASASQFIVFEYISEPQEVEETINRLRRQVQALDAGIFQSSMRQVINEHFKIPEEYEMVPDEELLFDSAPNADFFNWLRQLFGYRIEKAGIITYRKHLLVLLYQTIVPALGLLLLLTAGYFFTNNYVRVLIAILFVTNFGWFLWQFLDWRNDTYQLTNRYVLDIDRMPIGFRESRVQAELGNIQNVSSDKPGLFAVLFNFGSVQIETAGAQSNLVFENVSNPNRIKSDIFQKLEAYRAKQKAAEAGRRQQEYGMLIDVYRQAVEQDRIPVRTPPRNGWEASGRD